MRAKQRGFTLIELVIVIVILGILAVTALPKFIAIERDAKVAVLKGAQGAIKAAADLVHGSAMVKGISAASSTAHLDFDNDGTANANSDPDDILLRYGYPYADSRGIPRAVELDSRLQGKDVGSTYEFRFDGIDGCEVRYTQPSGAGKRPTVTIDDSKC